MRASKRSRHRASAPLLAYALAPSLTRAQWCPDCVPATPVLRDVYEDAAGGSDWDVVYVPSDKNATETEEYVKAAHGGWPRVETNRCARSYLRMRSCAYACARARTQEGGTSSA